MKTNQETLSLTKAEKLALKAVVTKLKIHWPGVKVLLFGSKVKGTSDEESDLDLLIMLTCPVTEDIRRQIVHMVFDINLHYESNISVLIISQEEWDNSPLSLLPIHADIEEEGILL